jgi:hypothetical protein
VQGVVVVLWASDGPPSGLEIDISSKKLSASSEAITAITDSTERMWSRTLDWAERSPIEFALVAVVLMFIVVQRRRAKTTATAMTIEYELQRERIRNRQPPLPLPPPELGE